MSKKRVLVLGGTGAMGFYLVPELIKNGFMVDVTSRKEAQDGFMGAVYIHGNALDDNFLKEVIVSKKYDAIIDFMVYSTDQFKTRRDFLLENTGQYVFISSYRVYSSANPIVENSPRLLDVSTNNDFLGSREYSLEKARQEDLLRLSQHENWTIVRPSITYSRNRFQFGTMEADTFIWRALNNKPVAIPSDMLSKQTTLTWAGDVAKMITKLIGNKQAFSEDYNVVTSEHHSWKDVSKVYKGVINLKIKTIPLEKYIEVMGGGFVMYQVLYDRMVDRVCDNKKILKVTGMKQSDLTRLEDGLMMELREFIKDPKYSYVDESTHKKMDIALKGRLANIRSRIAFRSRIVMFAKKIKHKLRLRTRYRELTVKYKENARNRLEASIYDGAIVTLPGNYNYGNLLQKYALQKFLQKNDLRYRIIDTIRVNDDSDSKVYGRMQLFFDSKLDSMPYEQVSNVRYKSYIVGSDQVWRNWYGPEVHLFYNYFLDFVKTKSALKISYAASFGVDKLKDAAIDESIMTSVKPLLGNFNHISVREESAVKLVGELIGEETSVKCVIDPTLLLSADDYTMLIDNSEDDSVNIPKLFCYVLDENGTKGEVIRGVANLYNEKSLTISPRDGRVYESVELWLKGFRDAEFVITDSFHGTVFSIINNTPFVVFANKERGVTRMKNLLEMLGIDSNRLIYDDTASLEDVTSLKEINWSVVNQKIENLRADSGEWLLSAIEEKSRR